MDRAPEPLEPVGNMEGNTREELARKFRHFALCETGGASPLYEALSLGIAEDRDMLALAAARTPPHPAPNLIFAAVHALLLRGEEHALAEFYPTITGGPTPVGDPFPAFRAFCREHRAELERLLATRFVQTNEVGRSALLLTGLGELAREAGADVRPLTLIEVGASAGLNLLLDRFTYEFRSASGGVRTWRSVSTTEPGVELYLEVRGERPPPLPPEDMRVLERVGIDKSPLDLSDPDDELWLRALVWPDQAGGRMQRLTRAIEAARENPPELRAGDALDLLSGCVRAAPAEAQVVVMHTATLYLLTLEERALLEQQLRELSRERPVVRLGMEWIDGPETELTLASYSGGRVRTATLAVCHSHGAWIEWRAPAGDASVL